MPVIRFPLYPELKLALSGKRPNILLCGNRIADAVPAGNFMKTKRLVGDYSMNVLNYRQRLKFRRDLAFGQGECFFSLARDVLHIEGLDEWRVAEF